MTRPWVCADGVSAHTKANAKASATAGATASRTQRRTLLPVVTSLMTFPPRFCSARWCRASSASGDATDREVIERRDRIGFRPQSNPTGPEPGVPVIEEQLAVEPALDVVAERDDAHRMPLPERRRLDAGARQLTAPAVVVVQTEVVLERVRADDVVLAVREAEDDATRGVFPSRDRLELHRDFHIGVRAGRRHHHVELVPGRALDEHLLTARRAGQVLDGPLAVHRRPSVDTLALEVEAIHGNVVRQLDLRWRGTRPPTLAHAEGGGCGQSGLEQATS